MTKSYLFIPAHEKHFIERAHTRNADAIILDLEDGVPSEKKSPARDTLAKNVTLLANNGSKVIIRVNRELADCAKDLDAATLANVDSIILPKVAGPDHVVLVDECLQSFERERGLGDRQIGLITLVETPQALLNIEKISRASPRIKALAIGTEDFSTACGFDPSYDNLFFPCHQLIVAARAVGISAIGVPGSIAEIDNLKSFSKTADDAKAMGFDGAFCIHPKQVKIVNSTFAISDEDRANAERIVAAYERAIANNQAAVQLNGKMVDPPIVARALALLGR